MLLSRRLQFELLEARKLLVAVPIGYWTFDDPDNVGRDDTGAGNDLTAIGGAAYDLSGVTGGALLLDGVDSYLGGITPLGLPVGDSSYTIASWVKPESTGARGIVGWGGYGAGGAVHDTNAFRLGDSNAVNNYWWGDPSLQIIPPGVNLHDGNWHHLATTYDGTTRTLWVDGNSIGSNMPGANNAQPVNFAVGRTCDYCGPGEFFDGRLDDVAIWDVALSPPDIEGLADGSLVPFTGNQPPVAANDSYDVTEDETFSVDADMGVLDNDSDVEMDPFTAVLVSDASDGTLTLNFDGSFEYTPAADFFGSDTFTYLARDIRDSDEATVTLNVANVYDPAVAVADSYVADVDAMLVIDVASGVLANDENPDMVVLTAIVEDDVDNGALVLAADGSFTYDPDEGFSGIDTFDYKVNDTVGDSNVVTVMIEIDAAPVADDESYVVSEDRTLSVAAPGVLDGDSDPEMDPLSAVLIDDVAHGTLTLAADGSFQYTPALNFDGSDSFTYVANDSDQNSAPATVTIDVTPANDPPLALDNSYVGIKNETIVIGIVSGVLGNDLDPDGPSLTAMLVSGPSHGTLNLQSDGSFTYQPNPDFAGNDSFTYKADDSLALSSTATVTLSIRSDRVTISEFMASNDDALLDEDGDDSDWVEIFNFGDEVVDLGGWYLTDNANNLDNWRFPTTLLAPGDFLVVHASGRDRGVSGSQLHTNFRLSTGGEYLALVRPDGQTVVSEFGAGGSDFLQQYTDISYGSVTASGQSVLLDAGSPATAFVPTDDSLGTSWTGTAANEPFDDSPAAGWTTGIVGVGFSESSPAEDFFDGFGGASLGGSWTLDNPGTATVSTAAGVLRMDVPTGNNALATRGTAPLVYREPPSSGDYSIITHVDTSTLTATATGGIIVYDQAAGHYPLAFQWGNNSLVLIHGPGTFPVTPETLSGHTDVFLRLDRDEAGDSWSVYYKLAEADEWIFHATVTEGNQIGQIADPKPGLMARSEGTGSVVADFDFFQIDTSGLGGTGESNPVQLNLESTMKDNNATAYVRAAFTVGDPAIFDSLSLQMQYDDGFVAYLNGTEVARRNASADAMFNSSATTEQPGEGFAEAEMISISQHLPLLVSGTNILAIHGMNAAADDDDFLVNPRLVAATTSSEVEGYFLEPTPGAANGEVSGNFGPAITEVTETVTAPADDEDLVITARVTAAAQPVDTVTLHYRVMYQAEVSVEMVDDGSVVADVATDGIYTAVIPASESNIGQMVRWAVSATDIFGVASRAPIFLAATGMAEYFGTMIADPSIDTLLPQFHWFVENPDWYTHSGNGGGGSPFAKNYTTASIYYGGEFYDNVQVRIRGASSVFWEFPKQSLKFVLNPDHHFHFLPDEARVREINVNALWQDKGYIRNRLAMEIYRDAGIEYSETFMLYTQQNGTFHSVSSFAEQVNESLLKRHGLDPDGALYKINNGLGDTTNSPPFVPGAHDSASGGVEKKTRRWEDNSDLGDLIGGLRSKNPAVLFDNLDVPQVLTYLAVSVIIADWDMTQKNWYVYRDTEGTGQWSAIAWDRDNSLGYANWMSDNISVITSPLFHDNATTLHDAIYDVPVLREMYLRRLRTVLDELMQPPGTPSTELKLETRIEELYDLLHADVDADKQMWGNPWGQSQDLRAALDIIKNGYLAPARNSLYASGLLPLSQIGGEVINFTTLVSAGAPAAALVPVDDSLGDTWSGSAANEPFDETGWIAGTTGVGYEDALANYNDLIQLDIGAGMETNDTVYVRVSFEVSLPHEFERLHLNMKYDDGFVAYLNGVQVAQANAPIGAARTWNSSATANFADANNTNFNVFDITQHLGLLREGTNILAFHGLNHQTGGTVGSSSDMLLLPELRAGTVEIGSTNHPHIEFGDIEGNPASGNQDEEYIQLVNNNVTAVDISGWTLTGGVEHTFAPGVVLPSGGSLYVSPDEITFRVRSSGPSGGQGLFVQGNYSGHISNFGETIELVAPDSTVIDTINTPFSPSPAQQYLRIIELHYNPPGSGDPSEFIELTNISSATTLDLSGAAISDGPSQPFTLPPGTMLAPGDILLIVKNQAAFQSAYPAVDPAIVFGDFQGSLSNAGENIKLDDPQGSTILEFTYNDNDPWAERADGNGASLELIDPAGTPTDQYAKYYRWRGSTTLGGSPGATGPAPSTVVINEVLAHTDPPVTQSDSIELFNPTASPIDISGWWLSDSAANLLKFQIPGNTTLGAGQYVVFGEDDFNPTPLNPGPNDFALSGATGDDVWLTDPDGGGPGVTWLVDDIHFGASPNGETFGRVPNGTGRVVPLQTLTLGADNSTARVGPLVISEVNYNPATPSAAALAIYPSLTSNDLEFIEIHNRTADNVDLTNWTIRRGVDFDFPATTSLAANEVLVLVSFDPNGPLNATRTSAFRAHYGIDVSVQLLGGYTGQLSNADELVVLHRPDTPPLENPTLVPQLHEDEVLYDDLSPWPATADGGASTLHRTQVAGLGSDAASWTAGQPGPGSIDQLGDADLDGDVDTSDLTTAIINFTGALGAGKFWSQGDTDGDGDVDTADLTIAIIGFTGALAGGLSLQGGADVFGAFADDLGGSGGEPTNYTRVTAPAGSVDDSVIATDIQVTSPWIHTERKRFGNRHVRAARHLALVDEAFGEIGTSK